MSLDSPDVQAAAAAQAATPREAQPLIALDSDTSPQHELSWDDAAQASPGGVGCAYAASPQMAWSPPPFDGGFEASSRSRSAIDLESVPSTTGVGIARGEGDTEPIAGQQDSDSPLASPEAPAWSPPPFEDECMLVTPVVAGGGRMSADVEPIQSSDDDERACDTGAASSLSSDFVAAVSAVHLPEGRMGENAPLAPAASGHAAKRPPSTPCSASLQPPLVRSQGWSDPRLAGGAAGSAVLASPDLQVVEALAACATSGRQGARCADRQQPSDSHAALRDSDAPAQPQLSDAQAVVMPDSPLQQASQTRRDLVDLTL